MSRWVVERWKAGAALLHARPMPADLRRRISLLEVTHPALVLGSTSPTLRTGAPETGPLKKARRSSETSDHPRSSPGTGSSAGVGVSDFDVVRRQSGGGLVWLDPIESTWLDVFIPQGDSLWQTDVARSFEWVGQAIAAAFASLGADTEAHFGPESTLVAPDPAGGWLCFGSLGNGEVIAGIENPDGTASRHKLVGISQRRTRAGSRFSCVWYRHFSLGAITEIVPAEISQAAQKLACGWASLGLSFGDVVGSNRAGSDRADSSHAGSNGAGSDGAGAYITQRVIDYLTGTECKTA